MYFCGTLTLYLLQLLVAFVNNTASIRIFKNKTKTDAFKRKKTTFPRDHATVICKCFSDIFSVSASLFKLFNKEIKARIDYSCYLKIFIKIRREHNNFLIDLYYTEDLLFSLVNWSRILTNLIFKIFNKIDENYIHVKILICDNFLTLTFSFTLYGLFY